MFGLPSRTAANAASSTGLGVGGQMFPPLAASSNTSTSTSRLFDTNTLQRNNMYDINFAQQEQLMEEFPDIGSSSDFPALGDTVPAKKKNMTVASAVQAQAQQSLSGRIMAGAKRVGNKPIVDDFPSLEASNPRIATNVVSQSTPPGNLMGAPKTVLARPSNLDSTYGANVNVGVPDANANSFTLLSRNAYAASASGIHPDSGNLQAFGMPQNPKPSQLPPPQLQQQQQYPSVSYPVSRVPVMNPNPIPSSFDVSSLSASSGDVSEYGLKGLLKIIRMSDLDLNTLALGTDLTTLGLDLNSTEVLYPLFTSPFADSSTTREPDYKLPECYYRHPPALKTSHLSKFSLETLFYIFYSMPKDTLQVFAAKELYARDWRYHKKLQLWFTQPDDNVMMSLGYKADSLVYFDTDIWERRVYLNEGSALTFMSKEEIQQI